MLLQDFRNFTSWFKWFLISSLVIFEVFQFKETSSGFEAATTHSQSSNVAYTALLPTRKLCNTKMKRKLLLEVEVYID